MIILAITGQAPKPPFVWFSDEDTEILGDRICSKCHNDIPEDEVPVQLFGEGFGKTYIARFHSTCFEELVNAKIIELGKP